MGGCHISFGVQVRLAEASSKKIGWRVQKRDSSYQRRYFDPTAIAALALATQSEVCPVSVPPEHGCIDACRGRPRIWDVAGEILG